MDGREAPAVLEREPHHSAGLSRVDGCEGRVDLGCQLQRGSRHGDAALCLDGRERLGDVLEHEPHRGADVSLEREGLAVLDCQVQRESRHSDAPSRLDGDPLEHQSRSGDGEEVGSLVDDLGNANASNLTVETSKILIFRLRRLKLAKTHSILLYGRDASLPDWIDCSASTLNYP